MVRACALPALPTETVGTHFPWSGLINMRSRKRLGMVMSAFSPVLGRQRQVDTCEFYIMSFRRVRLHNALSQNQNKAKKRNRGAEKGDTIQVSTLGRGTNNVLLGHCSPT